LIGAHAVVVLGAQRSKLAETKARVTRAVRSNHWFDVVGGNGCADDALLATQATRRLDVQLMLGTLAMLTEAIPTTWIDGVWVWFRSRH